MPLIEDGSRALLGGGVQQVHDRPIAAVPAIGGTGRLGRRSATSASISWATRAPATRRTWHTNVARSLSARGS